MKKKILSALLVGAMVSSLLAGCGGSDSASTSDNSTSAGSSDAQTTEQGSSDATAEASGIEGKTVAFIPKLTGNAFFEGANDEHRNMQKNGESLLITWEALTQQ